MRDRKARPALIDASPPAALCVPRGSHIALAVAAALAAAGVPLEATAAAEAADSAGPTLQEVVVTARKRSENLQDVPVSINVFTAEDLRHLAVTQFEDYAEKTPSISFISTGPGLQLFVMRGVSDGSNPSYSNSSTTGFFVDDISTSNTGVQPDLHLYDIERIEVLNGPQGTTFGAGSMAGAIRYVTNKPDVAKFSAGADFETGKIQGGQANWTYEGFVNLPLIPDRLGVRVSAFSAFHGGFINNQRVTRTWKNGTVSDNSLWARDNYNREHVEGGRITLKGVLSDRWSASLMYMYQRLSSVGAWDEDPALPARTVARFGPEANTFNGQFAEARIDGDIGIADLVYATTYWTQPHRQHNEYSQYMENYLGGAKEGFACLNDPVYGNGPLTGCNVPVQFYTYRSNSQLWSNELRLVSRDGGRLHWLGGLYWEKSIDRDYGSTFYMPGLRREGAAFTNALASYYITEPSLAPGLWYFSQNRSDYRQTTEFANISFDLTDRLTLEAGGVHFHSDARYHSIAGNFSYAPPIDSVSPSSSNNFNAKAGASYKLGTDAMVYFNFAQGFRDGGSNSGYPAVCYSNGVPKAYVPDTLNNYELGWKSTVLGRRLLFNGALYWMDWKDLQTTVYDPGICASSSFNANVGDARIYGVESNLDFRPDEHWSLQLNASYNDPHLISNKYPTLKVTPGERLPYSPYFSWSWNARYQRPIGSAVFAYAQLDVAHKGDMWNDLHVSNSKGFPRVLQPGYSIVNLRLGLNPEDEHWLVEAYVTNLLDKNAIIYTNTYNFDLRQTTNEPRVIGLRLSYRYGKQ